MARRAKKTKRAARAPRPVPSLAAKPDPNAVQWIVFKRTDEGRLAVVIDKVLAHTAFDAWKGSRFYAEGYAFASVCCYRPPYTIRKIS